MAIKKIIVLAVFFSFIQIGFSQKKKEKISTTSANVHLIKKEFKIKKLNSLSHKIWIYLPPDYNLNRKKKYSVIYMFDGQNLFDNKTSFLGEWQVDESLNAMFKLRRKGIIVVGIENGRQERINEYTPYANKKYGGGKGAILASFMVHTLKPFIDNTYRTKKQAKHTGIIGSSLGGLMAYYCGLKYPKTFGKIAAFSPSFWFSKKIIDFTNQFGNSKKLKLYLSVGELEENMMKTDAMHIKNQLELLGFPKSKIKWSITKRGKHNEFAWREEFKPAVKWLFNIK
ncbi:MAG: alpha/beta hydrolase [Lutibacter sp.]